MQTLLKAIELLDDLHKIPGTFIDPDYLDAIAIGQQALKRIEHCRDVICDFAPQLLPGETPPNAPTPPVTLFSIGY